MNRLAQVFGSLLLILFISNTAHAARIILVAGGMNPADGVQASEALLKEPFGTDFDKNGNTFVIEMASGNRLLKIDAAGKLRHLAGTGKAGNNGDGGPALQAEFNGPHNLAVLPDGNVLIGDTWNGRVRKVDVKTGRVSAIDGFGVDVGKAKSSGPYCITLDFTGTKLYVADLLRVHLLDLNTGTSKVIAGNGQKGKPVDGTMATEAPLSDPRAVAPDRQGNVYILERGGNALRVVDVAGKIRTVVNASGKAGSTGDGGPALEATLSGPKHLCVDLDDTIIIADAENHVIRRYLPKEGRIVRVAGTGKKGSAGVGGDPTQCELARPHGVVVHPQTGELYITDTYNHRVLKIVK